MWDIVVLPLFRICIKERGGERMSGEREITNAKEALLQVRRLYVQEEMVGRQLEEVEMVLAILETRAWTAGDFVLKGETEEAVERNRLDRLALELDRRRLVGRDSYTGGGGGLVSGCAFWTCVWHALHLAGLWLQVHQHRKCLYIRPAPDRAPNVVYMDRAVSTDDIVQREPVPGARNQVAVAFQLVALLYATFNIRIPARGTSDLWGSLVTYAWGGLDHMDEG